MQENKMLNYLKEVLNNMPAGWLITTTHRLDIYDEALAKTKFLDQFESLYISNISDTATLNKLPTAYDYIRLGHPLSCVLEWGIAHLNKINAGNVISFSSQTIPILGVLRKNLLEHRNTRILYSGKMPSCFNSEILRDIYNYNFVLQHIDDVSKISEYNGSTILISQKDEVGAVNLNINVDFYINLYSHLGSVLIINGNENEEYIADVQHVRRRETIAMTPANTLVALQALVAQKAIVNTQEIREQDKASVLKSINAITGTVLKPLVASSGLSIQYAIMMGLIHDAQLQHKGKAIKFIVPPNCYGGTNDQARRVAACIENVTIVDLPVDGDNDMVQSIDTILNTIANEDAIPYIIAEIPTNPRVEVPDLNDLKAVLSKVRKTKHGEKAIDPVFILDQTFCPNVLFLGDGKMLSTVRTISYASGSKFPSGGRCTAGYCVGNSKVARLLEKIDLHLNLCDNEATAHQYAILAEQLPSMNLRIKEAYKNTHHFVNFIEEILPEAKINFVSDELAAQGFTPSVFSLDLPTKGNTDEERETFKRALNLKLINLMISEIPNECKFCVSYGQLKGSYWTIPATSTQGTTKEGDKDYIVRASLSATMDLELHKLVFSKFVASI